MASKVVGSSTPYNSFTCGVSRSDISYVCTLAYKQNIPDNNDMLLSHFDGHGPVKYSVYVDTSIYIRNQVCSLVDTCLGPTPNIDRVVAWW